ncbi:hypothetical protein ACKVWC_011547 [Pyricularia oryzae]
MCASISKLYLYTFPPHLQRLLNVHNLPDALLNGRDLGGVQPLERPPGVTTVAVVALDGLLGAGDSGLCQDPVALAQDLLQLDGLVPLALGPEVPDLDADLGHDVGAAGDDAAAAAGQGLHGKVADAAKGHVAGALGEGRLGLGGGGDAGQLAGAAAGELCADDVGVLGQLDDEVRVHVDAGHGARVVVQHDGYGARVGHGVEVARDGLVVHEAAVVAGREEEDRVGAHVGAGPAQLDRALDRALGGADDDGHSGEAGGVEGLARRPGHGHLFLARAVHRLAVGAHGD